MTGWKVQFNFSVNRINNLLVIRKKIRDDTGDYNSASFFIAEEPTLELVSRS